MPEETDPKDLASATGPIRVSCGNLFERKEKVKPKTQVPDTGTRGTRLPNFYGKPLVE